MALGVGDRTATVVEPVSLVAEECAVGYGRDLLAYLLGAGLDAPLAAWRLDDAAGPAWPRLDVCYRVLQAFKEPSRARAWIRQASPALGGRTYAWAIRSGEPDLLDLVERAASVDERQAGTGDALFDG